MPWVGREAAFFALLLVLRTCEVTAWTCSADIISTASVPQSFEENTLHCRPGSVSEEIGNLTVQLHPALSGGSFSGFTPTFAPESTARPALITFFAADNVTLEDSRLLNVNLAGLSTLIAFNSSSNTTIRNLTSYGCPASLILLNINTAEQLNNNLLVQHCHFSNAQSGGIYVTYQNVTIKDTVFDSLVAAPTSTVRPVLYHNNTDGSSLAIHNCTFSNIQSMGMYAQSVVASLRSNATITNSTFSNCTASYAIVYIGNQPLPQGNYLANETTTVDGCSFSHCNSTQGAVYHLGKAAHSVQQLNLYNSMFVDNTASYGGAVTTFAVGTVQVVACRFEANYAIWGLSAVYVYGWSNQITYFTMHDSAFVGNNGTRTALADPEATGLTDTNECGGLYLSSCKCVGIANSVFDSNIGKGLCIHGQLGSSPDCHNSDPVFFNQSTLNSPDDSFLDTFLDRLDDLVITVDIRGSDFSNNTDAFLMRTTPEPDDVQPIDYLTGGAGLDIQDVLFTIISSSTFTGNSGRQGSAVHLDTCFTSYIWNCTFANNTATGQGGALALVNSHSKGLLLANSTFTGGQALFGGAIYGDVGAAITISNNSQLFKNHAVTAGGAVFCDNCQSLTLELQTNLSYNTAEGSGGAVYADGVVLITVEGALMTHNMAGGSGGALFIYGNGFTLTNITDSTFAVNHAQTSSAPSSEDSPDGGAISIFGGVSVLSGNIFQSNTAAGHGGALAYEDLCFTALDTSESLTFLWAQLAPQLAELAGTCSYFITSANNFTGNHADIAGGVMYSTNISSMQLVCDTDSRRSNPSTDCATWTSFPANTVGAEGVVGYGPGLAFPPAAMTFAGNSSQSGNDSSGFKQISYISDGSSKVPIPVVNVLDQAGSIVKMLGLKANLSVTNVSSLVNGGILPQLPGQTEAAGDSNGNINITDLVLIATPGVYELLVALPEYSQVPPATLQVDVQPCGIGQIPSSNGNQCISCPSGSYSFDPSMPDCKPCPFGAACIGGATLVPQQQYWHSAADSDHIVTCPNSNACAGNTNALLSCQRSTYDAQLAVDQALAAPQPSCNLSEPWTSPDPKAYMRQLCSAGYYGPVCSLCVASEDTTYGRVGSLQCKPCRRHVSIIAAYVASTLLVLAWLGYTIHVTLVENEEAAAGHDDPQRTSQLIRALNLWLQYMTLLGGINIPTPKTVHWVFAVAQFAFASVSSGSLSTDCLLTGPTSPALQRILIHLAVPILMFILLAAFQALRWWRSRTGALTAAPGPVTAAALTAAQLSPTAELKRRLLITLLEVLFYYYPSLLTATLSLFACFHLDPAGAANAGFHNAQASWHAGYWVPDMTIQCFQGWHKKLAILLGTPLMTLTWVVVPLMPVYLLARHRQNLDAPRVQLQLGYIYRIYRPKLWFWNSVVLLLTLALAASQIFATALDAYFQLTIMLVILMLGVTAFAHFRPFVDSLLQRMQVLGLFVVQITAAGCLYFLDPTNIANGRGLAAAGVLLMLLNIAYVVAMLFLIASHGARKTMCYTRSAIALLKISSARFKQSISRRHNVEREANAASVTVDNGQRGCQGGQQLFKWDFPGVAS